MSGFYWVTGEPDGPPLFAGWAIADPVGALNGAFATLAALFYRQRTGIGQHVDTCMLDSMIWMEPGFIPQVVATEGKADPGRKGRHCRVGYPAGFMTVREDMCSYRSSRIW